MVEGSAALHADDLLDKPVFDVNGHRLGRVSLVRDAEEGIVSFDVALSARARRALREDRRFVTLWPGDVVATDFAVSLAETADHVLHPRPPEVI